MNAHIINCEESQFSNYITNGYIGVGIVIKGTSPRSLLEACRITYSMYADMKTIFPGDMIFVHAGGYIYGVFKAESTFKELRDVNPQFLSANIHYEPEPNNPNSGWKKMVGERLENIQIPPADYRRLSISHYIENGKNLCFKRGFLANEVFKLKRKGKIWSIPERWRYPDESRTIRPIMLTEARELIKLLEMENEGQNNLTISPAQLNDDDFAAIDLILNPEIVKDEKIIEAWLCENLGSLKEIFGNFTCYGNNVQIGYLQGVDIFGYVETLSGIIKYKIIEIKTEDLTFEGGRDVIKQILGYMDWVIEFLGNGAPEIVEGYIVAKSFDQRFQDFVRSYNHVNIGRQLSLVKFDYHPQDNTLTLNRL
mgnify:CR=1 FL=1